MRRLLSLAFVTAILSLGDAYSKYGRTCKDIGCPSNEICVIKEDACTLYTGDKCGKYPSCTKVSNAASTCETFICPPTQLCRMDRGQPKCFDDPAATGSKDHKVPVQSYNPGAPIGDTPSGVHPSNNNYNPQNTYNQNPYNQNPYPYNPAYPQNPNSGVYPHLAPGQTTPRPNVYQPGQRVSGGGYQGGQVGSGYPGGYPSQSGGYPGQGYQGQGYPGQGYPGQGYPAQGYGGQGGYSGSGGYPKQNGNYPRQGGGYKQGYGSKPSGQDSSNPIVDRITGTLKTLGLFWFLVKFMISRVNGIYS